MHFSLTPEQELLRDSTLRLVQREIAPILERYPADRPLPKAELLAMLRAFRKLGLTSPRLPESVGGSGMAMLDYGIMFEQIPPAIGLALMAHEGSAARLFAEGSDEQRARLLPDFIAGDKVFCTGSTEPDTGSDPRGVRTRLWQRGGGLFLDGRKMWVSNIAECDAILVTCLDCRDGKPGDRVVKVVVERADSPFESEAIDMVGLRQGWLGEAVFDACPVDPANVVESERGGTEVLKASWGINRPLFSLLAVHLAKRALDIALDYARVRRQFGKPIAAHQLVQKNLSDIETAVVSSRLMCYSALSMFDQGKGTEGIAAMAKRYTQNACTDAVWQAMNVLGAMGLSVEAKLEAMYRDVRMIAVGDGTNEILALIHGRELTGLEAFRGRSGA